MKAPSRKTFKELLFGVHNIAPEPAVEPGDKHGRIVNSTALAVTDMLYALIEKSADHKDAVLLVARLLAETTCAQHPERYAQKETQRGLDGDRHGDNLVLDENYQIPYNPTYNPNSKW